MTLRTRSRKPISIGVTGAPRVLSVTIPRGVLTARPSILSRRSGRESATRSTTLSFTASRSVIETAWRTAFSAQSAFRPRSSATVRMNAAASFSIFFIIVLSTFPPPSMTGDAAPMLVAGAIAATCAASVMKTPAEAARAPGAVVWRRVRHDISADEWEPGERAHERLRLVGGEPADLGRAGGGRVGGVHRVDVERAVDRSAPKAAEPLAHPGDPLLLHRLDTDHLDPVLLVEGEVVGAVEGAADAHLDHAARVHEPLLDGPTERRPVEELGAEVLVPRVRVGVEVDEPDRPVAARERSQDRQRHRVIAADPDGHRAVGEDLAHVPLDRRVGALDRDRHHVHIAAVRHPPPLERMDLQHGVPRPDERRLLAHGPRAEPRARAVRNPAVVRDPDERDVEPCGGRRGGEEHERRPLAEPGGHEGLARLRVAHPPRPPPTAPPPGRRRRPGGARPPPGR